jgi:dTDP-4-dehydrorhamnose reductase
MNQKLKCMIFGSNGQDGYYLCKLLEAKEIDTICVSRKGSFLNGDVSDYPFIKTQVRHPQPTHVFDFAADSTADHAALIERHQTVLSRGVALNVNVGYFFGLRTDGFSFSEM